MSDPWDTRRWRKGIVRSSAGVDLVGGWLLALSFGGVAVGIGWKAPHLYTFKAGAVILVPYMFAVVGICALLWSCIATARWLRFRRCHLKLVTLPGVIGGHLRGDLLLPRSTPRGTAVRIGLLGERTTTTARRGQEKPDVSISRIYDYRIRIDLDRSHESSRHCKVPFDFEIPYSMKDATDNVTKGARHVEYGWRLRVSAHLEGADLNLSFDVPVFRTTGSDTSMSRMPKCDKSLDDFLEEWGEKKRVGVAVTGRETTVSCSVLGSNWKGVGFLACFGFVFLFAAGAIAISLKSHFFPLDTDIEGVIDVIGLLFPLVFLLAGGFMSIVVLGFGLLMLRIACHMVASRETRVCGGAVRHTVRLLGIPWRKTFGVEEVENVKADTSSSSGGTRWYQVQIELKCRQESRFALFWDAHCVTAATGIPTRQEAESVAKALRHAMGTSP